MKHKARIRLEMAADKLAKELLGIATDETVSDSVRLAATKDALDRAGLSAKTAMEIEVGPTKPFQAILDAVMSGGSRAESRSRRGEPDDVSAEDEWMDAEILDAQVVEDDRAPALPAQSPRYDDPPAPDAEPTSTFLDLEDALDQLRGQAPPAKRVHNRRSR
ncbi:hypothetical protein GPOL_c26600 [Gordonia polyisoprenivorans VH2]|uniref:Uncharacterized protein n=1 Tax=Gordonia polyisoprenivorans (strain DSM 44266 / VH2) TaxID=1112204 RepID=H6MQY4_GORPV|nr:hypothetical protein [Gordonia polyisoprenivorans]AFA73681.1 hypothetical protein GPOL_c26600 [Gordonia polyisoprenivorans VH2]